MGFRRTLLERLASPPEDDARQPGSDVDEVVESICRNLQLMLNSRHGSAPAAPDFGTSDFSQFFTGYESIDILRDEIRQSIAKYEPRLADVEVRFAPREDDPNRIYFEIAAVVISEDDEEPAVFRTVLEGSGEVKVSRE
jgi:type VI secretion system protein